MSELATEQIVDADPSQPEPSPAEVEQRRMERLFRSSGDAKGSRRLVDDHGERHVNLSNVERSTAQHGLQGL